MQSFGRVLLVRCMYCSGIDGSVLQTARTRKRGYNGELPREPAARSVAGEELEIYGMQTSES